MYSGAESRAKQLLAETDVPISRIGPQVGWTELFRKHVAMTPKAYRDATRPMVGAARESLVSVGCAVRGRHAKGGASPACKAASLPLGRIFVRLQHFSSEVHRQREAPGVS
jgi:hypothetical protein